VKTLAVLGMLVMIAGCDNAPRATSVASNAAPREQHSVPPASNTFDREGDAEAAMLGIPFERISEVPSGELSLAIVSVEMARDTPARSAWLRAANQRLQKSDRDLKSQRRVTLDQSPKAGTAAALSANMSETPIFPEFSVRG